MRIKHDAMLQEIYQEIKYKPSDNKDITHAYEFITGNSFAFYQILNLHFRCQWSDQLLQEIQQ